MKKSNYTKKLAALRKKAAKTQDDAKRCVEGLQLCTFQMDGFNAPFELYLRGFKPEAWPRCEHKSCGCEGKSAVVELKSGNKVTVNEEDYSAFYAMWQFVSDRKDGKNPTLPSVPFNYATRFETWLDERAQQPI